MNSKWKSHQGRVGPAQHSMHCGSTADASGHECVMPGAKHRFLCKPMLFLLATRVLNASPVGEGLRKTTQKCSPRTSAMPRVKASASPRLHVETIYGHTQRTDLKWEKKVIYPLVRDAQACKKKQSRMDTNIKVQMIWSTTKCNAKLKRQTHFGLNFNLKSLPNIVQKQVQGIQKSSKIHSLEASWWAKLKRKRF